MKTLPFQEVWEKLVTADESVEIEAKRSDEIGKSLLESVSSFSNEPNMGGGYLLLGVGLDPQALFIDYSPSGLSEPQKLQVDLACQCREAFSIPIRPIISQHKLSGMPVVMAFIPEAPAHSKPVFIKSRGLPLGAFRRIASTDQVCTDEDIAYLYQGRKHETFDETVLPETSLQDIESAAVGEYRRLRAEVNATAIELQFTDEELLNSLAATRRVDGQTCLTVAGLALFGKTSSVRRHFPMMRIDYILVEGREWIENPTDRYHTVELLECALLAIPRVLGACPQ